MLGHDKTRNHKNFHVRCENLTSHSVAAVPKKFALADLGFFRGGRVTFGTRVSEASEH